MREENKLENRLTVPEKENIFTRFFKWIASFFGKQEKEEVPIIQVPSITIPQAVKTKEPVTFEKNSVEYLYQLSDHELDNLNNSYDKQIEESQNELIRLNNMLQTYRQSIKKLQGQITEENN